MFPLSRTRCSSAVLALAAVEADYADAPLFSGTDEVLLPTVPYGTTRRRGSPGMSSLRSPLASLHCCSAGRGRLIADYGKDNFGKGWAFEPSAGAPPNTSGMPGKYAEIDG